MSWKGFWTLAVVYGLLVLCAWLTGNAALALIAAFLIGYELWDAHTGRPW